MEVSTLPRPRGRPGMRISPRLLARLSDERLVEQVRGGSEPAFEVLYDRHHRGILGFCRHMLRSQEEAEDAVQHTFISAYRDLSQSDKPIRLKAWLYTIARNRCLSMLRARREQAELPEELPTAGLSDAVLEREDLRRLLADVQRLPEDQRAALVLSELGDLAHSEIAEVVGCDPMKVKALVFQARSSLLESRTAADIPCHEIREQLATASGGALRRGPLRRHLRACPGCSEFREQVTRQRKMLALALPVVPTLGLKHSVLSAALAGGHGGVGGVAAAGGALGGGGGVVGGGGASVGGVASAGGATAAGTAGGGGFLSAVGAASAAKVVAVVAVVAAGGSAVAVHEVTSSHPAARPGASSAHGGGAGGAAGGKAGKTGAGGAAIPGKNAHSDPAAPGTEKARAAQERARKRQQAAARHGGASGNGNGGAAHGRGHGSKSGGGSTISGSSPGDYSTSPGSSGSHRSDGGRGGSYTGSPGSSGSPQGPPPQSQGQGGGPPITPPSHPSPPPQAQSPGSQGLGLGRGHG